MIEAIRGRTQSIPGDITGTQRPENLEQAAVQFEALFLRSMLHQMRKTVDAIADENSLFSSRESKMVRDFYDDQLAQTLASQRSSGIADLLVRQMSGANSPGG